MIESYTDKKAIERAAQAAGPFFSFDYESARLADQAERDRRRDSAHRLVKAAKSEPSRFPGVTGRFFNSPGKRHFPKQNPKTRTDSGHQEAPNTAHDLTQPGTWAVIEKREWSGESRLRLETRPGSGIQTPDNAGARITAMLTERGAKKISESCYYMACQRGGFSTFATLTLTPEARAKLGRQEWQPMADLKDGWLTAHPAPLEPARAKQGSFSVKYQGDDDTAPAYNVAQINDRLAVGGPFALLDADSGRPYTPIQLRHTWSIQNEATRFFRAAAKMYRRGWQYQDDQGNTVKVPGAPIDPDTGKPEALDYLWVAENPDRIDQETGEYLGENPHIHLLMRWRVPYRHFAAWAARLEGLWGSGFAHLEKLKDPQKAGSYVAKAAGYLSKAQGKGDQGEIRGNRYSISTQARAPAWIETERHQVGMMGWLLAEAHELWSEKHGDKIKQRETLKRELDQVKDGPRRQKIGRLLEGVRKEIEPLARASKYAVLFKSDDQKARFMAWAKRQGWQEKPQNSLWLTEWRKAQLARRDYRVITRIDEDTENRLAPEDQEIADWLALADAGAVVLDEQQQEQAA